MKIDRLKFGRTVNTGNFESVRLDAECDVDEDEDPSEVLEELIKWVKGEINKRRPQEEHDGTA